MRFRVNHVLHYFLLSVVSATAWAFSVAPTAATHTSLPPVVFQTARADNRWVITNPANHREIEVFLSKQSIGPGKPVDVFVHSSSPIYTGEIFRMGWYGGYGGALFATISPQHAKRGLGPDHADPSTGLVEPNWPVAFSFTVPTSWASGVYLIKITNADGFETYAVFVVRASTPGKIAFIHDNFTDQAYNNWGDQSLYVGGVSSLGLGHAVQVSFLRPDNRNNGAGNFFTWEYPMIRFLEREGYQMDYLTDSDLHRAPGQLQSYRMVTSAGHDEYWSAQIRQAYQGAMNHGVNIAVFGGNTGYWQVRANNQPNGQVHTLTCYKLPETNDPFYGVNNALVTTKWRLWPVYTPESLLFGSMYSVSNTDQQYPLVVNDPSLPIFAGLNLLPGTRLTNVVGPEVDNLMEGMPQPSNLQVAFESPVRKLNGMHVAQSTYYVAASGAKVFNAATQSWSWGVDDFHDGKFVSPDIQQVTRNIFNQFSQ